MTILLVGGGSGGHIAPLLSIAKYLKSKQPDVKIVAVTERSGRFTHMFKDNPAIDELRIVSAGKLRRYHNESWFSRIFDVRRNLLNIRDMFRLGFGLLQSLWLLKRHKPDLIFVKGGYVGVPVGFAARFWHIPYVTHDSDALPGLANRLIASHAVLNAVGMPEEFYAYPKDKITFVGIPVDADIHPLTQEENKALRIKHKVPAKAQVLFITGGSNGAQRVDRAVHSMAEDLLTAVPDLFIIHLVGLDNEQLYKDYPPELQRRIMVSRFLRPFSEYVGMADLVITRAGATTIAEFAAQAKPCIIIPNPLLTGGHQTKNAAVFEKKEAAVVFSEDTIAESPQQLLEQVVKLLKSEKTRSALGNHLHELLPNNATADLGNLLLKLLGDTKQDKKE